MVPVVRGDGRRRAVPAEQSSAAVNRGCYGRRWLNRNRLLPGVAGHLRWCDSNSHAQAPRSRNTPCSSPCSSTFLNSLSAGLQIRRHSSSSTPKGACSGTSSKSSAVRASSSSSSFSSSSSSSASACTSCAAAVRRQPATAPEPRPRLPRPRLPPWPQTPRRPHARRVPRRRARQPARWAVAAPEPRPRLPPWPLRRLGGLTLGGCGWRGGSRLGVVSCVCSVCPVIVNPCLTVHFGVTSFNPPLRPFDLLHERPGRRW